MTGKKMRFATVVGCAAVMAAASRTHAALVIYNFDASTPVPTTLDANVTAASVITNKGSTISYFGGNPASGKGISTTTFNTALSTVPGTTNGYQFSVTPNSGYTLNLSTLTFDDQASGSGPTSYELAYSLDSKATWTVVGAPGTPHALITSGGNTLTFSGLTNVTSQIYLDIFAGGASASGGTWRVDNLTVNGTSSLIGSTNDTVISAVSSSPIAYGRVIGGTPTVAVNKTGTAVATYSLTSTGGLGGSTGSIPAGTQSSVPLTFTTGSTLGSTSGNITIANTASSSAGAGQGSADPNDVISYTADVLQNRQVGDTSSAAGKSFVKLGKVMVGATATATGQLFSAGTDDQNTRITLEASKTASFSSTTGAAYTISLTTPSTPTVFNSDQQTVAVTGSGTYATAGAKSGNFIELGDSQSSSTSIDGKFYDAETGVTGQTIKTGNVYYTASVYSPSNGAFDSSGTKSIVLNFGTVTQGSTATLPYQILDLLGTNVAGFTAGLDVYSLASTGASAAVTSTGLTPGALIGDGPTSTTNSVSEAASIDTTNPGVIDTIYTITVGDDQTITGAAANSTPLTLEIIGTVAPAAVPEPVSVASLAVVGGCVLMRRRRVTA